MTTIGVSGQMFLLVPVHMGCPGQSPESRKMVVVVVCNSISPFSAVTLLAGWHKGHQGCKKTEWSNAGVAICLG